MHNSEDGGAMSVLQEDVETGFRAAGGGQVDVR